jgi:uncharacterized membrane protein
MKNLSLLLLLLFPFFQGHAEQDHFHVDQQATGQKSFTADSLTLTLINGGDFADLNLKKTAQINLHIGEEKVFDVKKTELILFDLLSADRPSGESFIDSIKISVNGSKFNLPPPLMPFTISGLEKGEHTLTIELVDTKGNKIDFPSGAKGEVKFSISKIEEVEEPYFMNDAVVLGILLLVLALVFKTSAMERFGKFYRIIPALLLCYFIPSILNSAGLISGEQSNLYFVASRYLLPASLILLCLSIDLKGIVRLGPKAGIMFFAGTVGIIIGGPVSLLIVGAIAPDVLNVSGPGEVWQGLTTVAGSWIGGGANQTAMKEIYEVGDELFSKMIVIDVLVANLWMAILLIGASKSKDLDKTFKADASAIDDLRERVEGESKKMARIPSTTDLMMIVGIGLAGTAVAHFGADIITPIMEESKEALAAIGLSSLTKGFFWLIIIATTIGVGLSFTRMRGYEGAGASKIGTVFLYVLVATIGMKMDMLAILDNPGLFLIGIIWMLVHVIILLGVGKLIRAPFFFIAVGSQANVGGAASAPIVASAFSPALAPVGVLLAVLGYAIGTYGAIVCAWLMQAVS